MKKFALKESNLKEYRLENISGKVNRMTPNDLEQYMVKRFQFSRGPNFSQLALWLVIFQRTALFGIAIAYSVKFILKMKISIN